jgi:hypothetical protein
VDNVKADTKAVLIGDATKSRIFAVSIDNLGAMFPDDTELTAEVIDLT